MDFHCDFCVPARGDERGFEETYKYYLYIYIYVSLDIYDPEPILRIKTSITSEEIG